MSVTRLLLLPIAVLLVACTEQRKPTTIPGLGTLSFPVTTDSDSARRAFERGTLLLHLFHYGEARDAFRAARAADPGLTMAYWGEAMAWNYSLWNFQDADSARAVLVELAPTAVERRLLARSEREAQYLDAIEALYGEGTKASRDTLYEATMERVSAAFPDDDEARLFHALSLLGLNQGVRDVSTYLRAADIAEEVFRRHPSHPGASHYLIHSVDDPEHAARGLDAAAALAAASPDAAHAQHMTSHIFMALGMWDDVVRANENALRVASHRREAQERDPALCGHVNAWLNYGLLQQGQFETSRNLVRACLRQATSLPPRPDDIDPDNTPLGSAVFIWARYIIDAAEWSGDDITWDPGLDTASTTAAAGYQFTRGLAAVRQENLATAAQWLERFRRTRDKLRARAEERNDASPTTREYLTALDVMDLELSGVRTIAAGGIDSGVATLRRATVLEDGMAYAFGPPTVYKPSHELLGEELLHIGRASQAEEEFQTSLRRGTNRAASLAGLNDARRAQLLTAADSIL